MENIYNSANSNYKEMPENEIIKRCRMGDLDAFNVLISLHEKRVFNTVFRFIGNYHSAVDETQEIFIKVFRKISQFKGDSTFKTWLYRITVNHCLNVVKSYHRKRNSECRTTSLNAMQESDPQCQIVDKNAMCPEKVAEREELRRKLVFYIEKLPDRQYIAIILHYFEKLPLNEISKIMNLSYSSIHSCLYRAKKKLKALILKKGRSEMFDCSHQIDIPTLRVA
jgi:RNA polymerase sigma-70 factor, ECF subfamily